MGNNRGAWTTGPIARWVGRKRESYGRAAVVAVVLGGVVIALNLWEHVDFLVGKRHGIFVVAGALLDVLLSPAFGYLVFFAGGAALIGLHFFDRRQRRTSSARPTPPSQEEAPKTESAAPITRSEPAPPPSPSTAGFPSTARHHAYGDEVGLTLIPSDPYKITTMVCSVQAPDGVTVSATVYGIWTLSGNRYETTYPSKFPTADHGGTTLPPGTYYVTWTPQSPHSYEAPVRYKFSLDGTGR